MDAQDDGGLVKAEAVSLARQGRQDDGVTGGARLLARQRLDKSKIALQRALADRELAVAQPWPTRAKP